MYMVLNLTHTHNAHSLANSTHVVCPTKETTRVLSKSLSSAPQWRDQIPMKAYMCYSQRFWPRLHVYTVAVKKMLPFPLLSIPFVRLRNRARTDCKHRLAWFVPFRSVSFPAVVQQAQYCGMSASTIQALSKFMGLAT